MMESKISKVKDFYKWRFRNYRGSDYNKLLSKIKLLKPFCIKNGAYCHYDNDEGNSKKYGCLYNWLAVDSKKLAPIGWHVPSYAEWVELELFLKENGYGNKKDGEIGKSLASKTGWFESEIEETVGNNQITNNSSGFSALPGGHRGYNNFGGIGGYSAWWSSSHYGFTGVEHASYAYLFYLHFNTSHLDHYYYYMYFGFSVRCIRD